MKIKVLKSTRQIEIPESMTMDELKAILCKWAPYVAMDENKSEYKLVKKSAFGDIFSKFFGKK